MSDLHPKIVEVLERIKLRSKNSRTAYLASIDEMNKDKDQDRAVVSCSNIAHAGAAAGVDQEDFLTSNKPNIGIVTSYNDMLSAHQPFETFPAGLVEVAVLSTEAGGLEAGRLRVWAGSG